MCAAEHPILTSILLLIVPLGTHWRLVLFFCLYFVFLFYGAISLMGFFCFLPWRMAWGSMGYGTAALSCLLFLFSVF